MTLPYRALLWGYKQSKKGNSIYQNRIAQTVGVTPITLHRSYAAFSVSHVRGLFILPIS